MPIMMSINRSTIDLKLSSFNKTCFDKRIFMFLDVDSVKEIIELYQKLYSSQKVLYD